MLNFIGSDKCNTISLCTDSVFESFENNEATCSGSLILLSPLHGELSEIEKYKKGVSMKE